MEAILLSFGCPKCKGHHLSSYSWGKYLYCLNDRVFILKSKCKNVKVVKEVEPMKISKTKYGTGTPFLKGIDMEKETKQIVIKEFREQNLQSGLTPIIDFMFNAELRSLPLNQTNLGRLVDKFGEETDKWNGKRVTLYTVMATNPQTKQEVPSIRIKE